MNKGEIKKKYNSKIKELYKHNRLYYDNSDPIISDSQYDKLKKEIIELEKEFSFLKKINFHQIKM